MEGRKPESVEVVWAPEVRVEWPHERSRRVAVRYRQSAGRRRA